MEILKLFIANFISMFMDMSFYIMLGLIFVGILNVYTNKDSILKHFGKDNFSSVIKASAAGVPLPLCSCGVVPTAIELKKSGASNGAVVSFLISTPQTGIDSILATFSMMGGIMAIFRPIAAFCSGILGGAIVNIFAKNEQIKADVSADLHCSCGSHEPTVETSHCCCESSEPVVEISHCCCGTSEPVAQPSHCCCGSDEPVAETSHCCCGSDEPVVETLHCCCSAPVVSSSPKFITAIKYAFGSFLDEIALHFAIGMIIATIIATFLPADFFVNLGLHNGVLAMIAMVLIGLPMYICSTSSIPIAIALMAKGLSAGSAFVFLFSGPVTNIASLLILSKALGKKITTLYILIVVICSIVGGLIFDFLVSTYSLYIASLSTCMSSHHNASPLTIAFGIIFAILLIKSLIKQYVLKK